MGDSEDDVAGLEGLADDEDMTGDVCDQLRELASAEGFQPVCDMLAEAMVAILLDDDYTQDSAKAFAAACLRDTADRLCVD
jgi:hypothetical protein